MKKLKMKKKVKKVQDENRNAISANLEIVDIDSIEPWEKNPKKYAKKIDEVAASIKKYGQRTPVSVWTKDGQIYKGNNTWYAMKKLKLKKIAVLWQEFESQREATGYALIDNKTGEDQEWDQGALAALLHGEEFAGLKSDEISGLTGFKDKELKGLLLTTTELPDMLPDVDIEGGVPDKADFIVIQFESRPAMQQFKERLGFKTKHPRVVPYKDLLTVMSWNDDAAISADASHAAGVNYGAGMKKKKKLKLKRR